MQHNKDDWRCFDIDYLRVLDKQPIVSISPADLDKLLHALEVHFVALSQCSVSTGYSLALGGVHAPGIHYNLTGMGKLIIGDAPAIDLRPHTLIIVPPDAPFRIEAANRQGLYTALTLVEGKLPATTRDAVRRFAAGSGEPAVILICGYFHASYGISNDLFEALTSPIVEQFNETDHLDLTLQAALHELVSQEIGAGAMSAALLKQVIVALLRRSISSLQLWLERFSMIGNPAITRSFAQMVSHPGYRHTVSSLAGTAHLSRSAFMEQFTGLFGQSPITILRDMRMRQAAGLLKTTNLSIKMIAGHAGYKNRSSFIRAFKKTYDKDPSGYRTAFNTQPVKLVK